MLGKFLGTCNLFTHWQASASQQAVPCIADTPTSLAVFNQNTHHFCGASTEGSATFDSCSAHSMIQAGWWLRIASNCCTMWNNMPLFPTTPLKQVNLSQHSAFQTRYDCQLHVPDPAQHQTTTATAIQQTPPASSTAGVQHTT